MVFIVRQERLDDVKRMRLMEAAVEEFAERGFDAASYNKIIERSGLSKGTVYYYFDNKDSLFATTVEEICQRFLHTIGDLRLPDTKEEYWATAWEYHQRAIRFFSENPLPGRVMFRLSKDEPFFDEYLKNAHERATQFMSDLIARGQEIGAVRNDLPWETVHRLIHAMGRVLSSDIIEDRDVSLENDEIKARIEKFMKMMHDLSKRILTPEEVRHV
ncbi:MAG: TetR/AcrR family transcriptional regulator [Synergistaceae bacterium]|jgi:AcrR family transcriptional regulator|nr:TetR/AcrR family transcriptional regulator [Synergistaceae bacterium]